MLIHLFLSKKYLFLNLMDLEIFSFLISAILMLILHNKLSLAALTL